MDHIILAIIEIAVLNKYSIHFAAASAAYPRILMADY
jgi:hypothetical protein